MPGKKKRGQQQPPILARAPSDELSRAYGVERRAARAQINSAKGDLTAAARALMLGITGATVLGLLSLSITGDGVVGTVKQLWRNPAASGDGAQEEEEQEEQ